MIPGYSSTKNWNWVDPIDYSTVIMRIRNTSIMDDTEFEEPPNEKLDMELTFADKSLPSSVLAGMDTLRQAGQLCDCVLRVSSTSTHQGDYNHLYRYKIMLLVYSWNIFRARYQKILSKVNDCSIDVREFI